MLYVSFTSSQWECDFSVKDSTYKEIQWAESDNLCCG